LSSYSNCKPTLYTTIFMKKTINGHPYGLVFLFFTELWERFGYYLMIGIFLLFMKNTERYGLGFSAEKATDIFGTFIALAYLTPFLGGMLADKVLGYRKSIIIGGVLMGLGYGALGFIDRVINFFVNSCNIDRINAADYALWFALIIMVIGNGFFKPNISTLLGNLYNSPEYKDQKDVGYNIFYMGINIGAFICNFCAAFAKLHWGWYAAFLTASAGMFLGVLTFILGDKHYAHADVKKAPEPGEQNIAVVIGAILVPAFICGWLGYKIPGNIFGSDSTDAFLFFLIPVVGYYLNILRTAAVHEKEPIRALLSIYAVSILFWAIFKQNGTALTNWAECYTDREVPASVVSFAQTFGMSEQLSNQKAKYPAYDNTFRAPKDAAGNVVKVDTTHYYFINAAEKLPATGQRLSLISTEIFQSINPFFVVALTPLVVWFFARLRRRNREPTTATKIAWGLVITSLSSVIMILATWACHNGLDKASAWWLIGSYGIITIGELCLSPMGLSLVSKLAPARIAALMMGGWQLSTAVGNKMSGVLAGLWGNFDNKANYFLMNALLTLIAALMIFAMLKWLNRIIKQYVV
jgi:proton-dependent oligopeptide transporter, POT family